MLSCWWGLKKPVLMPLFAPPTCKLTSRSRAIHDTLLYKLGTRSLDHNALPGPWTFKRTKPFESPNP